MHQQLALLLPVLLSVLALLLPEKAVLVAHSTLGRVLLALVVIYCTLVDSLLGLLSVALLILFYQLAPVESAEGFSDLKEEFRKKNCYQGVLFSGNDEKKPVPATLTENVFSNIKFIDKPCNVCDQKCQFSVLE